MLQAPGVRTTFGGSDVEKVHAGVARSNLSYRFPIVETSATALCGTTGILCTKIYQIVFLYKQINYTYTMWILDGQEFGRSWWNHVKPLKQRVATHP